MISGRLEMNKVHAVVDRRTILKLGGSSIAATVAAVASPASATNHKGLEPDTSHTVLPYPQQSIAPVAQFVAGTPIPFSYPDASSPCVAVKLGMPTLGGVGPDKDIVAYSILCTHMGCPVVFDSDTNIFRCNCHYSMFDVEKDGQMIAGQAIENLPKIHLSYDEKNELIIAIGIDGMLFGRQANVL